MSALHLELIFENDLVLWLVGASENWGRWNLSVRTSSWGIEILSFRELLTYSIVEDTAIPEYGGFWNGELRKGREQSQNDKRIRIRKDWKTKPKFKAGKRTVKLQSNRVFPMECAMISGPSIQPPAVNQVLEEKINIAIHPEYPEQTIAIGSTLTEKGRKELCALLRQNLDIFAWKPADMTGVPRNIAEHRLNIWEGIFRRLGKRKEGQAPERNRHPEEVENLVDA
ncbi:hypothetical protein Tco_0090651 [Tanacetum coccineum]